jgi:seryl-tRNA synthetase
MVCRSPVMPTSVPGVALFSSDFEQLVSVLAKATDTLFAADRPCYVGVPPVISIDLLNRVGYPDCFPHLLGSVQVYDESSGTVAADIALLPAACYHVYPLLTEAPPAEPLTVALTGQCYRHERTAEPGRLRSFRMREFVRVAKPSAVDAWRTRGLDRAVAWLRTIGLTPRVEPASDPFFGSAARLVGAMQLAERLKWEVIVDVGDGLSQAVISANYHKEHFTAEFGITVDGDPAHTACVAFGLERLALAVIAAHGVDPNGWPAALR